VSADDLGCCLRALSSTIAVAEEPVGCDKFKWPVKAAPNEARSCSAIVPTLNQHHPPNGVVSSGWSKCRNGNEGEPVILVVPAVSVTTHIAFNERRSEL
jgi:hypothetical protein